MKKSNRPTLAFTPEIQVALLEEQASFGFSCHEPLGNKPWAAFIRRLLLLEVALDKNVVLADVMKRWPDFRWERKGDSTLRRWLKQAKTEFKNAPAHTKQHLRSCGEYHMLKFRDFSFGHDWSSVSSDVHEERLP